MKLPLLKRPAPSAAGGPSAAKKKRPSLKKLGKKKLLALSAAAALVIGLGGRTCWAAEPRPPKQATAAIPPPR